MIYRKRAPRVRRFRRRLRRMRKRLVVKRPLSRVHSFREVVELANVQTSATSQFTYFGYSFNLAQAGNFSTLGSLYDSYRICAVKITFYPQYNVSYTSGSTVAGEIPMIYTCIDYDTDTAPTTLAQVDQYASCKRQFFNKPHSRYLKPRALSYSALTTSSSTYANIGVSRKAWMDIANGGVKYFGLLGVVVFTNSTALPPATQVRVTATYYYQCKGQR